MRKASTVDLFCLSADGDRVDTLEQQLDRAYKQYSERSNDLHKNSFLQSLKSEP